MNGPAGRVLPLRVPLLPDEGIDSWLEALARRNGVTLRTLLQQLNLPVPSLTSTLFSTFTPAHIQDLERRCQLPAGRLDRALPDPSFPLRTRQARGSRYCPRCLADRSGRWQLAWWLPHVFACTTHTMLLHDTCPGCGRRPRRWLPGRTGSHPAGVCTTRFTDGSFCSTDLRSATGLELPVNSPLLSAQRWINDLLADSDTARTGTMLTDLHRLSRWLLHALPESDITPLGAAAEHAWTRRPTTAPPDRLAPLDAMLTAIITLHAHPLLEADDDTAVRHIQRLRTQQRAATALHPAAMTLHNWKRLSPRTRGLFIHAADAHLTPTDRVRLHSHSPSARIPEPGETPHVRRARYVPQLLWPHWTLRLHPPRGLRVHLFRGIAAALLFLPGAGTRDRKALLEPLHRHLPNWAGYTLTVIRKNGHEQVFPALCRIADYLDEHGSDIDYQRRRELIPAETISEEAWRELCFRTNTHPGERSTPAAPGRLLHARRYLFQLLTGADLTDPAHALAWKDASDRNRSIEFGLKLSLAQRRELFTHAKNVLEDLDIDEPVTWHPPEECAQGLSLPGPLPQDINLDRLRRLVITQGCTPSAAARHLGTTVTHVRLALEHIDQEPQDLGPRTPNAARKLRERARSVLTPAFLEQEYTQAGKSLTRIARETDFPRYLVLEHARAASITIYYTRRPTPIDEEWLRKQYVACKRSTADIATELGLTSETVRRRLQHMGIPTRPQGVHSRTVMLSKLDKTIPHSIRKAVEGSLHGWLRLHRFQIAMAFPSLETAADHIGTHQGSLVSQFHRLEADLGHQLYRRSVFGRAQRPTRKGKELLRTLSTASSQALITEALGPDRLIPEPDAGALTRATARFATRRNPGPLQPFDGIAVQRFRITAATRTVLRDLLAHRDEEFYGAEIHARTAVDGGTLYPLLKKLEHGGWLTSRPETEESWHGRAPAGCGPGRRRTYYSFTPEGLRAALHEIEHPRARRGNGHPNEKDHGADQ